MSRGQATRAEAECWLLMPLPSSRVATLRGRLTHRQQTCEFQKANLRVGSGKSMQMLNFEENGSFLANGTCLKLARAARKRYSARDGGVEQDDLRRME